MLAVEEVHGGVGAPGDATERVGHADGEEVVYQQGEYDPAPVFVAPDPWDE